MQPSTVPGAGRGSPVGRAAAAPECAAAAVEEDPAPPWRSRLLRLGDLRAVGGPAGGLGALPVGRPPIILLLKLHARGALRRCQALEQGAHGRGGLVEDSSASKGRTTRSSAYSPPASASPLSFISSRTSSRCARLLCAGDHVGLDGVALHRCSRSSSVRNVPTTSCVAGENALQVHGISGRRSAIAREQGWCSRGRSDRRPRHTEAPAAPRRSRRRGGRRARGARRAKWKPNTSTWRIVSCSCVAATTRPGRRAAGAAPAAGRRAARRARRSPQERPRAWRARAWRAAK